MAFSEIELQYIKQSVGALCRRRSPSQVIDELRTIYEIERDGVVVYETRVPWDGKGAWTKMGIAMFRYVRSRNAWKLYRMDLDRKWHVYESAEEQSEIGALVRVVDEDEHGVFFG